MMANFKKSKLVSIGKASSELGVSIDTLRRWDKSGKLTAIRMGTKGTRYYRRDDLDYLLKVPATLALRWVSSQAPYTPPPEYYCKSRDVLQGRLEHFQSELAKVMDTKIAAILVAIAGELGNNSFDHNLGNWPDITGVFFAYSLNEKQIVLADRGQGVLTTLKRVKPELRNSKEALFTAFTETISGRYPESRGNGLKFVKKVVIDNQISLIFQTGNASTTINNKTKAIKTVNEATEISGCYTVIYY